jgi:hypothetical protein
MLTKHKGEPTLLVTKISTDLKGGVYLHLLDGTVARVKRTNEQASQVVRFENIGQAEEGARECELEPLHPLPLQWIPEARHRDISCLHFGSRGIITQAVIPRG